MSIDETGQERRIAQIDNRGSGWNLAADGLDLIAGNNYDSRLNQVVTLPIEQTCGPQNVRILSECR